ncbi:autotransporter outer membrane beta-barrel domain-containing protein [Candidatus Pelagibacter sp.]|nr:autotransporter outer membrane beta-barrel domain-containing protein [Candidatus Pelagibacter sp.]
MSLVTSGGIHLSKGAAGFNPDAIFIGLNGKRLFVTDHDKYTVTQFTLHNPYDTSSFTEDGSVSIQDLTSDNNRQTRALGFSKSGLKMFVSDDEGDDEIFEFNLPCPFNIIAGKCPSITENKERTGIAEAQIETAKRAINMSTNSALNRLKWIRRNKDKENLSNQNAKLNFSGTMLSTLSPLPISSFKKISNHKTNKEDNKNYFHWSEGDISLGRIGETSTASRKENLTNAITYGVDRFKEDNGVEGFAIRYGLDDIDVGDVGSNLDSRTYNITYYNTSPMKNDTKYIDKIFGIGRIESDILTKLDGTNVTADRTGHQIYGTLKIKDEYKRNNLTFIPSGQIDLGHTKLDGYQEVGSGAIKVQDQHITTQNLRAALALVDDLSTDKYTFKRHGKLEYLADTDRSSSFKYNYLSDSSSTLIDNLETGALHNFNFEVGLDIIFPERFSLFAIYERNQTFDNGYSGHTDNLYLAVGYLPNKDTEYAFSLNGSENLVSNFEIKKKINDYNISFNLAENLMNLGEASNASINVNKVF